MNILSLFDGIGGAAQALKNLNISTNNFFASEIDKNCIYITTRNHPNIKHLGDIKQINPDDLPEIDLLIAGSPCQNLSLAGDRTGLEGKDSKLFYIFYDFLKIIKPKFFLLENVASMDENIKDYISNLLETQPVLIDSAVLTAQSRKRYYWTNIPFNLPENKNIYLKDILLETEPINKNIPCYERPKQIAEIKNGGQGNRIYSIFGKSITLSASSGGTGSRTGLYLIDCDGKITKNIKTITKIDPFTGFFADKKIRKLKPIECERLQGYPDNYTTNLSKRIREKILGNSFTVPIIEKIIEPIKNPNTKPKTIKKNRVF